MPPDFELSSRGSPVPETSTRLLKFRSRNSASVKFRMWALPLIPTGWQLPQFGALRRQFEDPSASYAARVFPDILKGRQAEWVSIMLKSRVEEPMTLELELSEQMSQLMADQLRAGEFKSPESLAMAAIARFLDDKAEDAHIQMLLDEAEASGPYLEFTADEFSLELDKIMAEARAEVLLRGGTILP